MKNCLWVSLACALALSISASQSEARGGRGGGGGRPGGGSSAGRPGDRSIGDRQVGDRQIGEQGDRSPAQRSQVGQAANKSGKFENKSSQLKTNYTGKNQPFSPAWYANHPRAWQNTHPHADAWAVASLGAATAWLGVNAVANDSVYTGDTATEDDSDTADESLTQEGQTNLPADESFLALGVFALAPKRETDANAIVQLAINRDGIVRGTYVDLLTNQEQSIEGAVDKQSQRVAWTVGENGSVTFETRLTGLTQATGPVTLRFQNGNTKEWTLARFETDKPAAR